MIAKVNVYSFFMEMLFYLEGNLVHYKVLICIYRTYQMIYRLVQEIIITEFTSTHTNFKKICEQAFHHQIGT